MPGERVQDQRVTHEELVVILLHDGPADARPALPVDPAHRIAGPIVAQRHELLGVADRGRERDAARLIFSAARQLDLGHRVALREHEERLGERDRLECEDQAQRVRPPDGEPLEAHVAAAQWCDLDRDLGLARGGERRQGPRRDDGAALLRDEPGPPRIADLSIEPVAPLLARLVGRRELLERRAWIGELLNQHQAVLAPARPIGDRHAVRQRHADGREPRQDATSRESPAEDEARRHRDDHEGEHEREDLVAHGAIRVQPDHHRGAEHAQGERAGAGEPPVEPVLERREGVEPAIQEALHDLVTPRTASALS